MPFPIWWEGKILFRYGKPAMSLACCCVGNCEYNHMVFIDMGLEGMPINEDVWFNSDFEPVKTPPWRMRYVMRQRNNPSPSGYFCVQYTLLLDYCSQDVTDYEEKESDMILAWQLFAKDWSESNGLGDPFFVATPTAFEPDTQAAIGLGLAGGIMCDLGIGDSIVDFPIYNARSICDGC